MPNPSGIMQPPAASSRPLEYGDRVLVTGATGFIGVHVVAQCLAAGLRVRATARTAAKATKLQQYFAALLPAHDSDGDDNHGNDDDIGNNHDNNTNDRRWPQQQPRTMQSVETVIVPDTAAEGAFDDARVLEGVHGVVHVASPLEFSTSWDVVTTAIRSTVGLLRAVQAHPLVRRVVVTSSSVVLGHPHHDAPTAYTPNTWDDTSVRAALAQPTRLGIYTASKHEAERALWDFVRSQRPRFLVVTVNPTMTYGAELPAASSSSTNAALRAFAHGALDSIAFYGGAHFFVNVRNVAQLHTAALTNGRRGQAVVRSGERLLAYHPTPYTYRDLVEAILRCWPDAPLATAPWTSLPDLDTRSQSTVDTARMQQLLGADCIIGLNQTVQQALRGKHRRQHAPTSHD